MEDASEHCAEVSRGIISKIMGDRGHGLPHRQLFQSKHQSVLATPDRERHACIAKEQSCERTFTGACFPGPAVEGSIVVGRLSQFLHDMKNPTILSVGNNQRRLPDDRYTVEKKANEAHFGRMGIHIPRDVDRDVQKLSAERVEMKTYFYPVGSELETIDVGNRLRRATVREYRTQCSTPAGIHIARFGGAIQSPCLVPTVATPRITEIS